MEITMDEKTSELMRRFKKRALAISQTLIARLIQEAQEEALAEAKATLKELWLQAILEQALQQDEAGTAVTEAAPVSAAATAVAPSQVVSQKSEIAVPVAEKTPAGAALMAATPSEAPPTESEEQIRQEIEAIRQKITENEKALQEAKASPGKTEKPQPLPTQVGEEASSSAEERREVGDGYYVYGIVGADGGSPLRELPQQGIDPRHPVYAFPYPSLQAIVSKVSLEEFGQEPLEANLNDLPWLEAHVRAHHSVLESVVAQQVIIPLKFCTIYRSEDGLREMLAQHHDAFLATLAALQGKKEWGVKVYVQRETLAREIEQSDRICKLKGEMAQKPDGVAYFLKRKLEETISAEMERYSDECAQASHDRLAGHAESSVINPLHSKEISGGADSMILNGAYLVAEEHLADFQSELAKLQEEFGYMGFGLEMTGPWPPYNFVSVGEEGREGDEAICSQGESSSS